jgi:hypothetical protein
MLLCYSTYTTFTTCTVQRRLKQIDASMPEVVREQFDARMHVHSLGDKREAPHEATVCGHKG